MNIQFCNRMNIYLNEQVDKIENGNIIPKQDQKPISVSSSDLEITPSVSKSEASILYEAKFIVYIDKLDAHYTTVLAIERSCILELFRNLGDKLIIGNKKFPVKIILIPNLNQDVLQIHYQTPNFHDLQNLQKIE